MLPGADSVAPSLQSELVAHVSKKGAFPSPAVVSIGNGDHGCMVPLEGTDGAPLQSGGDDVVAVLVDVGLQNEGLPCDPLERIAAALIKGADVLDDNRGWTQAHGADVARPRGAG